MPYSQSRVGIGTVGRVCEIPMPFIGIQSPRFLAAVADLGSLIWLKIVKGAVLLLSESFHFFFRWRHHLLDRVRDRNTFPAVINAEMRESTRPARRHEVINRTRSDAASLA